MSPLVRTLGYVCGIVYWMYLSVPRFDVERRSSSRYRKAVGITKNIWIGSGCIMLVLIAAFPASALSLCLALSLLTTFLCYMILDQIE
jgi:hypothetical protein